MEIYTRNPTFKLPPYRGFWKVKIKSSPLKFPGEDYFYLRATISTIAANPIACNQPDFKAKKYELDYLNEKQAEILERMNDHDQNKDLQIMLTKIELEKMKWISGRQGRTLFMRYSIKLVAGDVQPEFSLKVIWHIKIPETCPLTINNYFGEIIVENTKSTLKINSEFARITLKNTSGEIEIESKLGDISGKGLGGSIVINSNRANIDFEDVAGSMKIKLAVASIELKNLDIIDALSIEAEKSEIAIDAGNKFRFALDLENTDFEKPAWMIFDLSDKKENIQRVNF